MPLVYLRDKNGYNKDKAIMLFNNVEGKGRQFVSFDFRNSGADCSESVIESIIGTSFPDNDEYIDCVPCYSHNIKTYINCLKKVSIELHELTNNGEYMDPDKSEYMNEKYNVLYPWFRYCEDNDCEVPYFYYCLKGEENVPGVNWYQWPNTKDLTQIKHRGYCKGKIGTRTF